MLAPVGIEALQHHRALEDIRDSIEELRFYREHLLIPPASSERSSVFFFGIAVSRIARSRNGETTPSPAEKTISLPRPGDSISGAAEGFSPAPEGAKSPLQV